MTILLGEKSPKADLLQIQFMRICRLKVILLISECTSMILGKFAQKLERPLARDTALADALAPFPLMILTADHTYPSACRSARAKRHEPSILFVLPVDSFSTSP